MQYRPGRESDFSHLSTFVWQAIYPGFDLPDLTAEQRGENDRAVEESSDRVLRALQDERASVITAWDERRRALAGYIVVRRRGKYAATVDQLVVRRSEWGGGVAAELLRQATDRVGESRDLLVALRPYNARALAFFAKHGFVDTGEPAGDAFPERQLWLREGRTVEASPVDDFPTEADEPHFEPVYESLPDYTLATEELADDPVFDPEHSHLDEEQLNELEAFIRRAKSLKRQQTAKPEQPTPESSGQQPAGNKHPEIEFEIDYGTPDKEEREEPAPVTMPFEFAFEREEPAPAPRRPEPETEEATPVPEPEPEVEDPLELREIPDPAPPADPQQLRAAFEDQLGERLTAYFGADALPQYLELYWKAPNFHQIRDVALQGLASYLNGRPGARPARRRQRNVIADLIEYFVVETAADLHDSEFPQRVLRYQGVDWKRVDLFRLVWDYLNLEDAADGVYTDFVTIPPRILKNATGSYLQATRDERVFFICDQSLFGSGKQGFAMTDAGIYWKNVLQPAGAATYTTLRSLEKKQNHLLIDGQYFDAGEAFNLRVALLLDKLRRMELDD